MLKVNNDVKSTHITLHRSPSNGNRRECKTAHNSTNYQGEFQHNYVTRRRDIAER